MSKAKKLPSQKYRAQMTLNDELDGLLERVEILERKLDKASELTEGPSDEFSLIPQTMDTLSRNPPA